MADARLTRALFVVSLAVTGVVAPARVAPVRRRSRCAQAAGRYSPRSSSGRRPGGPPAAGGLTWRRASGRAT